jgi:hypothetical protein
MTQLSATGPGRRENDGLKAPPAQRPAAAAGGADLGARPDLSLQGRAKADELELVKHGDSLQARAGRGVNVR